MHHPPSPPTTYLPVLPVLFLEFLALSLPKSLLPPLLSTHFQNIYLVMGMAEAVKGILSALSGGWWGIWSDTHGRRPALFYTVLGTASSTILLSLTSLLPLLTPILPHIPTKSALTAWLYLFTISGLFSSTFTLTFGYISDSTSSSRERLAGYGMALATFGLSFCIGPMAGGAVADWKGFRERYYGDSEVGVEGEEEIEIEEEVEGEMLEEGEVIGGGLEGSGFTSIYQTGVRKVFALSLLLVLLDLVYIKFKLPESLEGKGGDEGENVNTTPTRVTRRTMRERIRNITLSSLWASSRTLHLPDPFLALRTFSSDPYLRTIGEITFLYYTAVWAVISSLAFYCNKTLGFGPGRLGELMSLFGVCTVFAEGVLVRIVVPAFGAVSVSRAGLIAFAVQCVGFSLARKPGHVFALVFLSTVTNLVYPSITGLVSEAVGKGRIGETLGAVNSIKALTEGFGPLFFGLLMSAMEDTNFPGLPYVGAGLLSLAAWRRTKRLDELEKGGYFAEKYEVGRGGDGGEIGMTKRGFAGHDIGSPGVMGKGDKSKGVGNTGGWFGLFNSGIKSVKSPEDIMHGAVEEGEREREGLLSEIEDETEEEEGEDEWAYWGSGVDSPQRVQND